MGFIDALGSLLDFGYTPYKQAQRREELRKIVETDSPDGPNLPMMRKLEIYGDANPGVWADRGFQANYARAGAQYQQEQAAGRAEAQAREAAAAASEAQRYDETATKELAAEADPNMRQRMLANYAGQAPPGSRFLAAAAKLQSDVSDTGINRENKRADTLLSHALGQQAAIAGENRAEARRLAQQNEVLGAPARGLTGQAAVDFQGKVQGATRAQQTVTDVGNYLEKADLGQMTISPSQRAVMGTAIQADMLPYLQQRFAAGAMQKGEQELFMELAGDPTAIFSWTPKQRAIMKYWQADIARARENLYGLAGVKAPDVAPGQSPFVQSLTPVNPKGQLRPWVPGGGGGR